MCKVGKDVQRVPYASISIRNLLRRGASATCASGFLQLPGCMGENGEMWEGRTLGRGQVETA